MLLWRCEMERIFSPGCLSRSAGESCSNQRRGRRSSIWIRSFIVRLQTYFCGKTPKEAEREARLDPWGCDEAPLSSSVAGGGPASPWFHTNLAVQGPSPLGEPLSVDLLPPQEYPFWFAIGELHRCESLTKADASEVVSDNMIEAKVGVGQWRTENVSKEARGRQVRCASRVLSVSESSDLP